MSDIPTPEPQPPAHLLTAPPGADARLVAEAYAARVAAGGGRVVWVLPAGSPDPSAPADLFRYRLTAEVGMRGIAAADLVVVEGVEGTEGTEGTATIVAALDQARRENAEVLWLTTAAPATDGAALDRHGEPAGGLGRSLRLARAMEAAGESAAAIRHLESSALELAASGDLILSGVFWLRAGRRDLALVVARAAGRTWLGSRGCERLAELMERLGEPEEARELYLRAADMHRQQGLDPYARACEARAAGLEDSPGR